MTSTPNPAILAPTMTDTLFNQRFDFLTPEQRKMLLEIWRDPTYVDELHELVCDLADEIDGAAEIARIDKLTPEELDAELRAEGYDPDGLIKRVKALMNRFNTKQP